ncbi:MAG TPA: phosphatidate cytidylyltransferase, partial [Longimicrobiaceae bacterium]|nr:phosphatidate cytidylyltransferase [Longimicrobiaceae bacterium]
MAISETAQRVLVAAVGIPVAVALVFAGGWFLTFLLALVAVLCAREFYVMAELKGARPLHLVGTVLSAGFVFLAALAPSGGSNVAGFAMLTTLAVMIAVTAAIWTRGADGAPLLATATTIFGAYYTGALLAHGIFLRNLPGVDGAWHGTALVFAPVLLTWASDTFAYFVGRRWGTRKLIPRVSPGKTVQGAVGAVIGTVAVAVAYMWVLDSFSTYRITL